MDISYIFYILSTYMLYIIYRYIFLAVEQDVSGENRRRARARQAAIFRCRLSQRDGRCS